MHRLNLRQILLASLTVWALIPAQSDAQSPVTAGESLEKMRLANNYFMDKWPDAGQRIVTNISRASNIWTRAVYYEGLMEFCKLDEDPAYLDYAVKWAEFHDWNLRDGQTYTRNADNQCAGQVYIDLYRLDPKPEKIRYIKASIDSMMRTSKIDDWSWIDAIQMGMPVFAKLGAVYHDNAYFERMHDMYRYSRDQHGDHGLFNKKTGLWWRDGDFDPPYTEPNGKDCYWSRGNGWVVMAMVRVLEELPKNSPHRKEYVNMLKKMCKALARVQRPDGFWNVSLHDPGHFGGREATGTAMFVYGMAWGVNQGILSRKKYEPAARKAWNALIREAVHPDGALGYVQGTGKEPSAGQPVTYDSVPDFEDYGLGAFLLAGVEMYKLLSAQ